MNLMEKLLPLIKWNLANGAGCTVFGQPWFQDAVSFEPQNARQGLILVRDLVDHATSSWDVENLMQLFGLSRAMNISSTVRPPLSNSEMMI